MVCGSVGQEEGDLHGRMNGRLRSQGNGVSGGWTTLQNARSHWEMVVIPVLLSLKSFYPQGTFDCLETFVVIVGRVPLASSG